MGQLKKNPEEKHLSRIEKLMARLANEKSMLMPNPGKLTVGKRAWVSRSSRLRRAIELIC